MRRIAWIGFVVLLAAGMTARGEEVLVPAIDGEWWTVAHQPDLGDWTRPGQEPVDFGMWQAADGTWQVWSCIRKTGCGGHTRLLYGWEGAKLTDTDWTPAGIKMTAQEDLGEEPGGLQAPHVIRHGGKYQMFYGNWVGICRATSEDGKDFARVVLDSGRTQIFTEDEIGKYPDFGTRDPMLIEHEGTWYCYTTARHLNDRENMSAVYCRTSKDLVNWSGTYQVMYGGPSGTNLWSVECPHVVYRHGWFYLFVTQNYKGTPRSTVYRSKDPLNFGQDEDTYYVGELPVAAMEIVTLDGEDYIASLLPSLQGIRVAKLKWVAKD